MLVKAKVPQGSVIDGEYQRWAVPATVVDGS